MITIRAEQMDMIAQRRSEQRALEHLWAEYPGEASPYSSSDLAQLVSASFNRAAGYGMRSEGALRVFAVLSLLVSPSFDEQTRIHEILMDVELPPDYRLLLLGECTGNLDWQEAQRQ